METNFDDAAKVEEKQMETKDGQAGPERTLRL
jgi:hypothetical protein